MDNSTANNSSDVTTTATLPTSNGDDSAQWITAQVLVASFAMASAWLTTSLAVYGWRNKKWRREGRRQVHEQLIFLNALLSPFLAFVRLLTSEAVILVGFDAHAHHACETAVDVSIVAYIIALMPAYVCVWIRQNALYADRSLGEIKTSFILVINWLCLVLIIGCLFIASVLFVHPNLYMASRNGCVLVPVKNPSPDYFFVVLVLLLILGQCLLLGLLIHPLRHYAKTHYDVSLCCIHWRAESAEGDDTTTYHPTNPATTKTTVEDSTAHLTTDTSSPANQSKTALDATKTDEKKRPVKGGRASTGQRLLRTMYRALACAFTCIVADLIALAVAGFVLPNSTPKTITNAVYDIALMIRLVAVVVQFDSRKKLVTALCKK